MLDTPLGNASHVNLWYIGGFFLCFAVQRKDIAPAFKDGLHYVQCYLLMTQIHKYTLYCTLPKSNNQLVLLLLFFIFFTKMQRKIHAINNLITVLSQYEHKWLKLCTDCQLEVCENLSV